MRVTPGAAYSYASASPMPLLPQGGGSVQLPRLCNSQQRVAGSAPPYIAVAVPGAGDEDDTRLPDGSGQLRWPEDAERDQGGADPRRGNEGQCNGLRKEDAQKDHGVLRSRPQRFQHPRPRHRRCAVTGCCQRMT